MESKKLEEIVEKIKATDFPQELDLVVAIRRGGIVPGYLLARYLHLPLEFLEIHFRDEKHQPSTPTPKLLKTPNFEYKDKKILLVDDRANSGATLVRAKEALVGAKEVLTCVFNGKADVSLFCEECFQFPWDL